MSNLILEEHGEHHYEIVLAASAPDWKTVKGWAESGELLVPGTYYQIRNVEAVTKFYQVPAKEEASDEVQD